MISRMPAGVRTCRTLGLWSVFILLGAVVNISVAWTCGRFSAFTYDESQRGITVLANSNDTHNKLLVDRTLAIGVDVLIVRKLIESDERLIVGNRPLEEIWPWWIEYADLHIAHSRHDPSDGVSGRGVIMTEVVAQGWPMPALWCERFEHRDMYGGKFLFLAKVEETFMSVPRVLAFRPLWIGFIANSIFYAAIAWLVIIFPFVIRRWLRARRGQCPACAYPIGASEVCTECGKPVRLRRVN